MEHLILIALAITLFVILKFRVKVVVTYQSSGASQRRKRGTQEKDSKSQRRGAHVAVGNTSPSLSELWDLQSALVNLGMGKREALESARRIQSENPGASFEDLLRVAIRQGRAA